LKLSKKRSSKAGLPPGTLVHIGEERTEDVRITLIDYDEQHLEEKTGVTVEECLPFKSSPTITWVNVSGIHDIGIIQAFGKAFDIHPLVLEDVVHSGQRPKMEDMGEYLYVVLKMLAHNHGPNPFEAEQVSLIVGNRFVISFQEREGDVFQSIRDRIHKGKGHIRKSGSDYLAYALMDAIVDNYFIILENMGEQIEIIQESVLSQPDPSNLRMIQDTRRQMIFLRRSIWPLRETLSGLQRTDSTLIGDAVGPYLGDVYDHTIQVIETIETLRETVSSTLDIYLSSLSNKMNEVMKLLTIMASIFIPLTFIAGIYGMNFKFMPELEWKWGYLAVWITVLVIVVLMLIGFRRKKWL